jgi:hypothetical protein
VGRVGLREIAEGGSKDKSKEEEGESEWVCEDSEEGVGLAGVGRELVSFLVFRFVCFWFGGGNRLERERREFEPVSSPAERLREQGRRGSDQWIDHISAL